MTGAETAGFPSRQARFNVRVEGMDCGACAFKIENAVRRLPGVCEINVNYSAEMLTLSLDENRTSWPTIEDKIRALGYTPRPLQGFRGEHASKRPTEEDEHAESQAGRWQTRKVWLVAAAGGLLLVAFAIAEIAPTLSFRAYLVAAVIGLLPVARRALAGATSGTPFSIETR